MIRMVNRGYLLVEPKQAFCDWAKANDPDFDFDESDDLEGTVYLIEDDFFEYEPVIEANFKQIFQNECEAVAGEEGNIPKATMEMFLEWFNVRIGSTTMDTLKSDLTAE